MTYYIKTREGEIYKGKSDNWGQVFRSMPFGSRLFNPYTKRTVIGWNNYKAEMARCQKQKYNQK